MADISAFPTIHGVVIDERGPLRTYTFTEAAKAGMTVGFAATGVSNAVVPMDKTSGEQAIGVAVYDVEAGDKGAVAMDGNICVVANADDTTAIDAGDQVMQDDNAVQGTVSAFTPRADLGSTVIDGTNDTTIDGSAQIVGIALEDILGDGVGEILVKVGLTLYSDHTVVT